MVRENEQLKAQLNATINSYVAVILASGGEVRITQDIQKRMEGKRIQIKSTPDPLVPGDILIQVVSEEVQEKASGLVLPDGRPVESIH